MTKVLVVDDHESMRESLERLFNESGDFCVVGGISCADHAVRMCGELSPDIVFMDVCTEGGASGLRATKEVRDAFPDIKVIVRRRAPTHSYIRAAASPSSSRPRAMLCRAADASPSRRPSPCRRARHR